MLISQHRETKAKKKQINLCKYMQPEYPSIEDDIRVTNFDQQFYFVAYPKCKRGTDACDDDDEMWCNHCNQQLPPMAT